MNRKILEFLSSTQDMASQWTLPVESQGVLPVQGLSSWHMQTQESIPRSQVPGALSLHARGCMATTGAGVSLSWGPRVVKEQNLGSSSAGLRGWLCSGEGRAGSPRPTRADEEIASHQLPGEVGGEPLTNLHPLTLQENH